MLVSALPELAGSFLDRLVACHSFQERLENSLIPPLTQGAVLLVVTPTARIDKEMCWLRFGLRISKPGYAFGGSVGSPVRFGFGFEFGFGCKLEIGLGIDYDRIRIRPRI